MLARYRKLLEVSPIKTNAVTAGCLAFTGDVIAQTMEPSSPEVHKESTPFDLQRNVAFTAFGALYMGAFVTPIYAYYPVLVGKIYSRVFRGATPSSMMQGIGSSFIDNAFHSPLLYIPSFYVFVGAMEGQNKTKIWGKLKSEWWPSVTACWALWIPVQMLTFSIVPKVHRVVFVSSWCLVWNVVLDYLAHR